MQGYWVTFTDGTKGYCQGQSTYDAVRIAEHLTGKTVNIGDSDKYKPELKTLPYPSAPIIWQFDHPVTGKTPAFCFRPNQCCGMTSCPQRHACDD
jgi:hypothetical protein